MLEERYIYLKNDILEERNSKLYLRYIDDILQRFQKEINSVQFGFSYSERQLSFLDTLLYKLEPGKPGTTLLQSFLPLC